jgi:Fe-S cluster assembly protein SufD
VIDDLAGDLGGVRLVFVDGVFAPGLSKLDALRPGLHCTTSASASGAGPGTRATPGPVLPAPDELARFDGFQALNRAAAADAAAIGVDPGVTIDDPVHVVHLATGRRAAALTHPRTVVTVGDGARLALVETFVGLAGGQTVTNASTTVIAGPGARVVHHRIQDEPAAAVHVGHTRVVQAAGSHVRSVSVMLGAAVGRHALDVDLRGEGATADLDGVYLPTRTQRHDNLVTVEHTASHGTSRQSFRGVVDDVARGSFGGHVIVPPGTVGTDAHQSNRNLVLTPTAQADTRPWLEILADDVACTHGATVGRLDDDALFYLRSRGIPRDEGRAMLVAAFVAEITDAIEPPALRRLVEAAVAARRGPSAPDPDPDLDPGLGETP